MAVVVVTHDCNSDLEDLGWDYNDLLDFICTLQPYRPVGAHDFKGARWCRGSAGEWYPCDAYAAPFDPVQKCRNASGPSIFLKFSIPDDGRCVLFTISAHD